MHRMLVPHCNYVIRSLLFVVAILAAAAFISGCGEKRISAARQLEVLKHVDQLYQGYIEGDLTVARAALSRIIEVIETSEALELKGKVDLLVLEYSRLYALEQRSGNEDAAEAALICLRYWTLRKYEMQQHSIADTINFIRNDTPGRIIDRANSLDKHTTKGLGPKCLQGSKVSTSAPPQM